MPVRVASKVRATSKDRASLGPSSIAVRLIVVNRQAGWGMSVTTPHSPNGVPSFITLHAVGLNFIILHAVGLSFIPTLAVGVFVGLVALAIQRRRAVPYAAWMTSKTTPNRSPP